MAVVSYYVVQFREVVGIWLPAKRDMFVHKLIIKKIKYLV